jgi:hypothetical protein
MQLQSNLDSSPDLCLEALHQPIGTADRPNALPSAAGELGTTWDRGVLPFLYRSKY